MSFWRQPRRQLKSATLLNALQHKLVPTVCRKYHAIPIRIMLDSASVVEAERLISVRRRELEIALYEMEEVYHYNFKHHLSGNDF